MKQIPQLHFAHLPTRIEELPRLTGHLNGPRILVKRDDQTGLAFGGNKTRKLEFLVADRTFLNGPFCVKPAHAGEEFRMRGGHAGGGRSAEQGSSARLTRRGTIAQRIRIVRAAR